MIGKPRRSIRLLLEVGLGAMVVLMLCAGVVGWLATRQVADAIRDTLQFVRTDALLGSRLTGVIYEERMAAVGYVETRDRALEVRSYHLGQDARRLHARLIANVSGNPEESLLTSGILEELVIVESGFARAHRLADLGRLDEMRQELGYTRAWEDSLQLDLQRLNDLKAQKVAAASATLQHTAHQRGWILIGLLLTASAGATLLGRHTIQAISNPLKSLVGQANELSVGNFTVVSSLDLLPHEFAVLASALNRAGESLQRLRAAEAALRQTEKLRAVGLLVSGVAHELNNPLAAILLSAEELGALSPEPDATEAIRVIREQALRARTIVRDLLASAGEREFDLRPVELGELVIRTSRLLDQQLRALRIRIHITQPEKAFVRGDPAALQQVVVNLLMNAAEASPPGGPVNVGITTSDTSCRVVFEDRGAGLQESVMPRLFEPFFTTKAVGEGTGLGLALSLGIVQRHGGTIEAENRVDGGARFTVSLPSIADVMRTSAEFPEARQHPHAETQVRPVEDGERHAIGARGGHRGRVLVVDDEEPIRSVLKRFFSRMGYEVDIAVDGECGLDLIAEAEEGGNAYSLVVCDLKMPKLTGPELHDRLAESYPRTLTRTIFCTGDLTSEEYARFVSSTARPVLQKPFEFSSLAELVERVDSDAAL